MSEKVDQQELTASSIFSFLWNRKKKLSLIVIVVTVAFALYSLIMPHEYQANASVLPSDENSGGTGLTSFLQSFAGGGMLLGGLGKSSESKVYVEILFSRANAKYIDDNLGISKREEFKETEIEEVYDFISQSIDAELEKSGIIFISVNIATSFLPSKSEIVSAKQLASDIANTAIDGLNWIVKERNVARSRKAIHYIEDEIFSYRHKLDSVENKLEEFQKENNILEIEEQMKAIVNQAVDAGSKLAEAESELNIAMLQFNPNSERIKILKKQVQFLKQQALKVQTGGTGNDMFSIPLPDVPELTREYANIYRDKKILEQVMLYLETQRHQEAIQEEKDVPVIQALDEAIPPTKRFSPSRAMFTLLGFMLSILFGSIYIVSRAVIKGQYFLKSANESEDTIKIQD